MAQKRCFVISPIGADNSPVREHVDDVFDFIIKPAMDELGIHVYRADHTQEVGKITEQMYRSILEEDLCIAVLTFHNPNVFYELAVAQCAAKPVIIMIDRDQAIPFDVKDQRAITYDLRPRPLRDGVYKQRIVEIVRNLEAANWKVEVPFGRELVPLGYQDRTLNVFDRVENYGPSERWFEMLQKSREIFNISGISRGWWTRRRAFRDAFLSKAKEGCRIRALLMHPDHASLPEHLDLEGRKIGTIDHVKVDMENTFAAFAELAKIEPNIEVRQLKRGCVTHQITQNDEQMLIAFLLYSQGTAQSPLLECAVSSPLYATIAGEFDTLWKLNEPTASGR